MRIPDTHPESLMERPPPFDPAAPRRPANLTVNSDLLRLARELGINLSGVLERALAEEVRARLHARWQADNAGAIADYNRHVEAHGVFSDGLRKF